MLCLGLPFLPLHIALLVDLLKLHVCFPAISNWRIKGAKGNIRCKSHESHVGSSFHVSKYNRFQTTCKSSGTHFNSAVAEAAAAAEQSRWQLAFLPKTFASVDIEKTMNIFISVNFGHASVFFRLFSILLLDRLLMPEDWANAKILTYVPTLNSPASSAHHIAIADTSLPTSRTSI